MIKEQIIYDDLDFSEANEGYLAAYMDVVEYYNSGYESISIHIAKDWQRDFLFKMVYHLTEKFKFPITLISKVYLFFNTEMNILHETNPKNYNNVIFNNVLLYEGVHSSEIISISRYGEIVFLYGYNSVEQHPNIICDSAIDSTMVYIYE